MATDRKVISEEARKFFAESISARWEPVDLSAEGLRILRAENSAVAKPGCLKVQEELKTTTKEEIIDGVPVQWVIPQHLTGEEIILFFFGGGFVCGCPEDDLSITSRLATWIGRRVCVPRYRLAPENPFPAAQNDAIAVYHSLSSSNNIILAGESAGGNLALGTLLEAFVRDLPKPIVVSLLSPWIDLTHSGESHKLLDTDPTLSVEYFLTPASLAYIGDQDPTHPHISPLFADIPDEFPPTIISTGTRDLLFSDSARLSQKLKEKGTEVDLQVAEGLWHVYEWQPNLPESSESLTKICDFINSWLTNQEG